MATPSSDQHKGVRHHAVSGSDLFRLIACTAIALLVITPPVAAVLGGFRTNQALLARPFSWPDPFVVSNYSDVLGNPSFWRQVFNSILVMVLTTVRALSLASAAAFVIARMQFPGREPLYNFFTLGRRWPRSPC